MAVDGITDAAAGSVSADRRELLRYLLAEEGLETGRPQALRPRARSEELPLSFAQQRLWFLHQLEPESAVYNVPLALRLTGELDVAALAAALAEVHRRHEVLRTIFPAVQGRPLQVVAEPTPVFPVVLDLARLASVEREKEARRVFDAEGRRPFNLATGPLVRVLLVRLAPNEHALLINLHHIAADAWSMGVLIREFSALYQAFAAGRPSPLPELPLQYADFALWQRGWLQGGALESQLLYWRQELADAPPALELPSDWPPKAVSTSRGARRSAMVTADLARELKALGAAEEASLFMVLLAAFESLLRRYTGQNDFLLGSPVANRRPIETEPLIGFFANTLVLRTNLGGDPPFRDLLRRVRTRTLAALAHQDLPFELLVEALSPQRNLGQTPLFQVVIALQNAAAESPDLPGIAASPWPVEVGTAKFDLTLAAIEGPRGLTTTFEYKVDLFAAPTIERMLGHWQTLLAGIVRAPHLCVSELPLLNEGELHQVLRERDGASVPSSACLHELFAEQARRRPAAVAVTCGDAMLSYGELDLLASRLAHRLWILGVGAESRVGLFLERSVEMVVSILAVLKAGAAYVPLDPAYPRERLAYLLEDSRPRVLLTTAALAGALPEHAAEAIYLDREWHEAVAGEWCPTNAAEPDNAAYVIYTSGSTGKPKGVVVTHANVVRLFHETQPWFGFDERDVWTLFHSYAFDFSVWELWGALLYGGRLVVVPYVTSRSPEDFHELLCREAVTVLNQTPSAFRQLASAALVAEGSARALRWVIFGGEALDFASLGPWFERLGDEMPRLVNMYGITETTVHVTFRPLARGDVRRGRSLIGAAIPDLQLFVLDEGSSPAPIGVTGELHVGGAGLARGYLHRADLTAQRFVPNPFAEPGARLYKTGDLARLRPDGDLEYLGRIDSQVQLRGFRIELGEIESALVSHPDVAEAAVVLREDTPGEPRLVAYLAAKGAALAVAEVRVAVQRELPEHMVPTAWVTVPALPRTAHGKIQRDALPAPAGLRTDLEGVYVAPRTDLEEALAEIWAQVLELDRIGVHDRFFALGGDSIRSVRVVALARERGINLSLPQIFQHQTIAELAAALAGVEPELAAPARSEPFGMISEEDRQRLPADLEDAYPMTQLQSGMLFHMHAASAADTPLYHNVDTMHLRTPLDETQFTAAVQEVVARHPVLRTGFDLTNFSDPLQMVHRTAFLPVPVEDVSALSPLEQEAFIDAYVEQQKRQLFDVAHPPLLRFHIHRRSAETFQFTLTECHAIFDGWSLHSTLNEILGRYLARLRGAILPAEPPPASSFRDYVLLERQAMESEECQRYWQEKLTDFSPTIVPRWPSLVAARVGRVRRHVSLEIEPEIFAGLKRLERAAAAPFKSVVLAAHVKALALLCGTNDVLTGLVTHGRPEEAGGEDVRGLFLNSVPLRVALQDGTWRDLVHAVFAAERELLPFRRYPLAVLQKQHPGQPLFETAFNYIHFHVVEDLLASGELQVLEFRGHEETHFTLLAHVRTSPSTGRTFLTLESDARQIPDAQARRIEATYWRILCSMSANPAGRHDVLRALSEMERHQVVLEWNDTARRYPQQEICLHRLIEAQAVRTPQAPAAVFGTVELSYEDLDRRANQLARHLRRLGVAPDDPIGICAERSPELLVGLLGILKAGGAYVPLDPSYPRERLAYMVEDALGRTAAPLLLTQGRLLGALDSQRFRGKVRVVLLDAGWHEIAREAAESLADGSVPDHLAYVIYTSGSTGHPKGAMNSHRAIVNRLLWMQETYGLTAADRVLQKTPFSFDVSVWELFWPLIAGGSVVLAQPGGHRDSAYMVHLIAELGITTVHFVPPMLQVFLEEPGVERCRALRRVFASGEALPHAVVQQFFARLPGVELHNLYGPTEAAVDVTYWACAAGEEFVPIGRPIANLEVHVLDRDFEPVSLAAPGELAIGGVGLARGYLGRPALTAEKFVPHPMSERPGDRLYRTGDLTRFLPDGRIEYLGRLDHQVKIRGLRVELGEIESVLARHPAVRQCVVIVPQEAGQARLVACVVHSRETSPDKDELRGFLRKKLPEFMVPSAIVLLEALPLTANGKVDRRALAAAAAEQERTERSYVAPRNNAERELAAIWQEVLRINGVGARDNFFDLGGDSLSLLRVYRKIRERFQKSFPITVLFERPTIADLAQSLTGDEEERSARHGEERALARQSMAWARRRRLGKWQG